MWPVLLEFELGPWHVVLRSYGTCLTAAVLVVWVVGARAAISRGLPVRAVFAVLAVTSLAALIGSRLLHWARHLEAYADSGGGAVNLRASGFALDGGVLLAIAAGWIACRGLRVSPWRMADALAVPLALGGAILRLGCFLNGCCFGRPTSVPWGVTFPFGSRVHLHQAASRLDALLGGPLPVHPTQLYEAGAMLLAAAFALWAARRRLPDGTVALSVAMWLVAFRWINAWFRTPERAAPLSGTVALLWVALLVVSALAVRLRNLPGRASPVATK